MCWIYFLKFKSDVGSIFWKFKARVGNVSSCEIQTLLLFQLSKYYFSFKKKLKELYGLLKLLKFMWLTHKKLANGKLSLFCFVKNVL